MATTPKKTLEEIKGDAHRISRGVRFATEENDCLARENDRHASARTSPGTGATGTSERSPSGATLSKRLRNGRSNLLKPSLTRRLSSLITPGYRKSAKRATATSRRIM